MAEVRLTAEARADLADIRRYSLAQFGGIAADRYFRGFTRVFALLGGRPHAGVSQPQFGPAVRSFTHVRHRIFYRIDGDVVRVMRILHHARNVDPGSFGS